MLQRTLAHLAPTLLILPMTGCGGGGGGAVTPPGTGNPAQSTTVGVGGGTATSADGRVVLEIPAGALGNDEVITITRVDRADASPDLAALDPDQIYRFEPDGLTFQMPATLTMAIEGPVNPVPGEIDVALPVLLSDSAAGVEVVGNSILKVDSSGRELLGRVHHFSSYATTTSEQLTASIEVRHPVALAAGEVATTTMEYFDTLLLHNGFQSWEVSSPDMSLGLDPAALSFQTSSFQSSCFLVEQPVTTIGVNYRSFHQGTFRDQFARIEYAVQCPVVPPSILDPTLLDLSRFGLTGPEEVSVAQDNCAIGLWIPAREGGVRVEPVAHNTFAQVTSLVSSGPLFDIETIANPTSGESLIQVNGSQDHYTAWNTGGQCNNALGAFLNPAIIDSTTFAGGMVSADAFFGRLFVSRLLDEGGFTEDTIPLSGAARCVVGNDLGTAFLTVTGNPGQFITVSFDDQDEVVEVEGADVGADPRRIAWDPATGIGGVSNFGDGTVTVFHWDGTSATPTVIDTVFVGSGPVGLDVYRGFLVCGAYFEDTYSIIEVDPGELEVVDVTTNPIPAVNPKGEGVPLQPGHARFAPYLGNKVIVLSLFNADSVLFLPDAY